MAVTEKHMHRLAVSAAVVLCLVVTGLSCTAWKTLQIKYQRDNEVTDTSAVLHWYSGNRKACTVEYGLTEKYGTTVEENDSPKWTEYRDESMSEGEYMWLHQVELTDLLPETTYYFKIPGTWVSDSFTTKPAPEFKITGYEVSNDVDGARLQIEFATNVYGVGLRFLDPSGSQVAEPHTTGYEREFGFRMATNNGPPVSGRWTLVASYQGEEIDRFTFDHSFAGTIVTITKVTLDWEGGPFSYTLANVYVEATNSGDLPANVRAPAEVTVAGRGVLVQPGIHDRIAAGGSETIALHDVNIADIPAGQTTFRVVLKGPNGEVVSTYSSTITPS